MFQANVDQIQMAIRRWNPWWLSNWQMDPYVDRENRSEFSKKLELRHVKDILGVRQCGKTTFMTIIVNDWINAGIDARKILLVNCDDFIIKNADFNQMLSAMTMMNPYVTHLILDEIQEKPGWRNWVRTLYETGSYSQILISGSNTAMLADDVGRELTGRHISTIITPFSFREYLWAKGWTALNAEDVRGRLSEIQYLLEQYFLDGGFPEVVFQKTEYEKNQILQNLANDIISRDILSHYDVDPQKIKQVFQYAMTNFAHEYSLRKIGNSLHLHPDTVETYLGYLKKCFAIEILPLFAFKLTVQFHENKKIYAIDSGLRNAVGFHMEGEKGKHAENVVFWELFRQYGEIFYWKNHQHEVDFVITEGMHVLELIQVCWAMDNPKIVKREKEGLVAAAKLYGLSRGVLITGFDQFDEIIDGITIHAVRLVEWLLLRNYEKTEAPNI
jgi:predicted AAA+ superfamily ATPase